MRGRGRFWVDTPFGIEIRIFGVEFVKFTDFFTLDGFLPENHGKLTKIAKM